MGYWGTLIAIRSGGQLPSALRDRNAEVREHDGALRGDGWQVYDVSENLLTGADDLLLHASTESAAPVLAAYIADSDYGWLVGVSPSGERWEAWLDPKTAYAFERDHHLMTGMAKADAKQQARKMIAAFGAPPAEAARRAVQWAAEAGYSVPAGPVRRMLRTSCLPRPSEWLRLPWKRYDFAEDIYFDILDSVGLPRA